MFIDLSEWCNENEMYRQYIELLTYIRQVVWTPAEILGKAGGGQAPHKDQKRTHTEKKVAKSPQIDNNIAV